MAKADLRHERRRERAAEADAPVEQGRLVLVVARRAKDRLRQRPRRQRRGLRHQRRRQRPAQPDAQPRAGRASAWSPDGRTIGFVSNRGGNRDIYVMNADGSRQRNLTHGITSKRSASPGRLRRSRARPLGGRGRPAAPASGMFPSRAINSKGLIGSVDGPGAAGEGVTRVDVGRRCASLSTGPDRLASRRIALDGTFRSRST